MLGDLNYLSIKENGLFPSDIVELQSEEINKNLVPFSSKDSVNSSVKDFGIIADNYLWVVKSESTGVVYSTDGKFVYGYSNVSDEEGEYIKYLLKDKLVPINKIKIRRNDKMSDTNSSAIKERIAKMREEQDKRAAESGAMQDSNAFTENKGHGKGRELSDEEKMKKLENEQKFKKLSTAIKNISADVNLNNVADLYAYNQTRSEHIGWITDRDVRITAKASEKVVVDEVTKKPKLAGNAPKEVMEELAKGKRPAKEFLVTSTTIKTNQIAPGASKFAIVEMPVDGIIPMDKLRDPNFKIDLNIKEKSDRVIKFYNKKEYVAAVISLLGGSIKESPKTNAEPTVINVFLKAKPVTDKETGNTENKLTPSITTASKRKLITATNYFPKTTFATMKLDEARTEEDRDKLNLSLFGQFFREVGGNPRPYDKLDPTEKAKLSKNDAGKIVSKFFDPQDSIPLDVVNVFTGAAIANPEIPLKEEVPTKDGKSTRLVNVTYDVTRSNEDPYGINPFNDPRFAKILDACGGNLTAEVITELYAKSKKRKSGSATSGIILSAEESTKIYLNVANLDGKENSPLKEVSFSEALNADEMREFASEALQSLNNYYASK